MRPKWRKFALATVCIILLSWNFKLRTEDLKHQISALRQFPTADIQLKNMYAWVNANTPTDARFITSPSESYDFNWLTERATIAKLKFLPQNKPAILEWNERLANLTGGASVWPQSIGKGYNIWLDVGRPLAEKYGQLTTEQVQALMQDYQATYMLTHVDHRLNLPVLYQNEEYILYTDLQ